MVFERKHIDKTIVALSLVPVLLQFFFSGAGAIMLGANWLAAGLFAWIIWDDIERHHLGLVDRNHSISISWALISMVLNYAYVNFNEYEIDQYTLFVVGGFLIILSVSMRSWQMKVAPLQFILSGVIIGLLSSRSSYCLLWIILFPVIFYHMRSWSKENWGSVITGIILAVWMSYAVRLIFIGEESVGHLWHNYSNFVDGLLPDPLTYSIWEWIFLVFTALLLIIYSISGFFLEVAKTVKANASIIMLSTLSLILTIISLIDLSHLPNYLGLLSIFLSYQISIHQSCIIDAKNDWWTVSILILYAVFSIFPIFLPFFF